MRPPVQGPLASEDVRGPCYARIVPAPIRGGHASARSAASSSTSPRGPSTGPSTTTSRRRSTASVAVGCPVLVPFGAAAGRRATSWTCPASEPQVEDLKPLTAVLGRAAGSARRRPVSPRGSPREYVAPLSDALRLFLPPGRYAGGRSARSRSAGPRPERPSLQAGRLRRGRRGTTTAARAARALRARAPTGPSARSCASGALVRALRASSGPAVGAVDDRVAELVAGRGVHAAQGRRHAARRCSTRSPRVRWRCPSSPPSSGSVHGGAAAARGGRRRHGPQPAALPDARGRPAVRAPSRDALGRPGAGARGRSRRAVDRGGGVVLLDGVTGSGKTEVYLRAIERVLARGQGAIVLVPEISLTPQTVGPLPRPASGTWWRSCTRRLSAGRAVRPVGARAHAAPRASSSARARRCSPRSHDLGLVVIDEEHEHTYKQGQAPRYHARDVAERLCAAGRARRSSWAARRPAGEHRRPPEQGRYERVVMSERVAGGTHPGGPRRGHGGRVRRRPPLDVLAPARRGPAGRGRARREGRPVHQPAGFRVVPAVPRVRLRARAVRTATSRSRTTTSGRASSATTAATRSRCPPRCPSCGSPYLRQFGTGTQRVEAELWRRSSPGMAVVRMDADTTIGQGRPREAPRGVRGPRRRACCSARRWSPRAWTTPR